MAKTTAEPRDDTSSPGRRAGLDPTDIVDAALELVATEGPAALTMRRLSVELGVKTPTVYWHVGSRDALVAEVIRAQSRRLAEMEVSGSTPRERVFSAARNLWTSAVDHRAFTSLAHQNAMSSLLAHPVEEALVVEIERAGLSGDEVARTAWAITSVIGGSLLLELRDLSAVPPEYRPQSLWASADEQLDPATRAAMQREPDFDAVCAATLRIVVDALIPDESTTDLSTTELPTTDLPTTTATESTT